MHNPIIRLCNAQKSYRLGDVTVDVLRDVSIEVKRGDVVVIRGMSGSGKTTLLNVLGGLDTVDRGEVHVADTPLHSLTFAQLTHYRAKNVGVIFQFHNLIPTLTVVENVLCGLEAFRPIKAADHALAHSALEAVGLYEHLNKFPSQLSGGQQQRVAIARAVIKEPELILADEPTGSLDEETGRSVMELLRELQEKRGCTIVVVTHNPGLIEFASETYEMRNGALHLDERRVAE